MPLYNSLDEVRAHAADNKAKRKRDDERDKKVFRHDWRIAIFSIVGGAIGGCLGGFLASYIFYLITK